MFSTETTRSLITAQPGVIAGRVQALYASEIDGLETLITKRDVKESEIQRYLEQHPTILRALGYRDIFAQVVLRRDDGTALRPDFILRPAGSDWCDILELKLPRVSAVIGARDRRSLSHGLHQLGAQLREYSRYFDDAKYARRVEDVLGIKCYRPTLIGVVGRDFTHADDRQIRAAMTTYANTKIMTFDELFRVAKSKILI